MSDKPVKRLRRAYTTKCKLEQLEILEKSFSNNTEKMALETGIPRRTLRNWVVEFSKLRTFAGSPHVRKIVTEPKTRYPQLEEKLRRWILEKRLKRHPISFKQIINQAKVFAIDFPQAQTFVASNGWFDNFIQRANFSHRRASKKSAENNKSQLVKSQQITGYLAALTSLLHIFPPHMILNMDEIPASIDMEREVTYDFSGIANTGHDKDCYTVTLTIAADGTRLPTYVIFKRLKKCPNVMHTENLVLTTSDSGFMSESLMVDYVDNILVPYSKGEPLLLILDEFSAHKCQGTLDLFKRNNITPILIPGGYTWCLQPLDVTINKPFKTHLRDVYSEWFSTSDRVTKAGNIARPNWQETVDFVDYATQKMETTHIRQSFVLCGVNFYNKCGAEYFDMLNSELRICLTFDEDWDHEHWIQSQISAKTVPYPYSDLIEPSDFMQPFSENRKNKMQVKEIVDSHITDIGSVLSNLFD